MNSSERAAELRALADQHDSLATLETDLENTVTAYREDPTEETRQAYAEASLALREARKEIRSSGLMVASSEPGSVAIGVQNIGAASKEN